MRDRMLPGVAMPWPAAPPIAIARSTVLTVLVSCCCPARRGTRLRQSNALYRRLLILPTQASMYHRRKPAEQRMSDSWASHRHAPVHRVLWRRAGSMMAPWRPVTAMNEDDARAFAAAW